MMGNEQVIVLLIFLVAFIFLIIAIRFWPIKKAVNNKSVTKFRKLNLLTGQVADITEEDLKNDISLLMKEGYEMTLLNELFHESEHSTKVSNKYFEVLGKDDHGSGIEKLTQQLVLQKASIIFYRSLF